MLIAGLAAGCGSSPSTVLVCGSGVNADLSDGPAVVKSHDSLDGAAISADEHVTIPQGGVVIQCSDPAIIAPDGYYALGPAVTYGPDGYYSDRPFQITIPYIAARMPKGGNRSNVRVVARTANGNVFFPAVSNRVIDDKDSYKSYVTINTGMLTTYEVVADEGAGETSTETFGWNAIIGVSMGGNAAMAIGLRHPDKFDVIADLGGEPGPSIVYSLNMVRDYLFGGFCSSASLKEGQLCPLATDKPDQFESASDYEHMTYQAGDGVGLTLDRSLYMQAARDLSKALSNPALYNTTNPYTPPGVDPSYIAMDPATRCANPVVLSDFFDATFNPDGSKPVVTFCDGGDSPTLGLGVFDPSLPQTDPAEVLLAADLNGNGTRDSGEPVITQAYEPFDDTGRDGKFDKDEPGYDAKYNPDPDQDDFHYLKNPLGQEGNGLLDDGELYQDWGLDGVQGTCQAGQTPPTGVSACYDYGEGNGKWDMSPNVQRWYEQDLQVRLAALTDDQRQHVSLWFDAGIRDFLNASVSANAAIGIAMAQYGLPFGVYDGFGGLVPGASEAAFDFDDVQWKDLPKDGYLRYGNPDASADDIMAGDGRHVGTANEIIYRIETAFAWIDKRFPDGDRDDALDNGTTLMDQSFTSPNTGRVNPFALFLPPGYNDPANATKTYPVIYVLHGYGQQPDDLVALASVVATHMISTEPLATRIQKFIMVFVDGRCRPGDGCEEGTFYMNAPLGGPAQMEQNMLDLMDYINAHYRTRTPSPADVTE